MADNSNTSPSEFSSCEEMMQEDFATKHEYTFWNSAKSNLFDCEIYRRLESKSGLYHYYAHGYLKDIQARILFIQSLDAVYRTKWDTYAQEITVLEDDPPASTATVYWQVKFPWPLTNRDYVFTRKHFFDSAQKKYMVSSKASAHNAKPEKSSPVRVTNYLTQFIFVQKDKDAYFWLEYFDDPRGNIPTSIINWAVSTVLPKMLTDLHKVCSNYPKDREQEIAAKYQID